MNFTIIDLVLLGLFTIFISVFLFKRRKNLKKEGLLLLYRTKWGMKLIDKIGDKYKKLLGFLGWISIVWGFILMAGIIYLFGRMVWIYIFQPQIVQLIKVPPILPLFPYIPQIFKLNFLPPFYFIYWIIIIAIVAVSHEFFHGIFMRKHHIKIKSTGFGFFPFFLPIFLAAFVEQDEKSMNKSRIRHQMAVLSAGTFANTLIAVLFFVVLVVFFSLSYSQSGIVFDSYSYSLVAISSVTMVGNTAITNATYDNILNAVNEEELTNVKANNTNYILTKNFLESQKNVKDLILLYNDAPAIKSQLGNVITGINGVKIDSKEKLAEELSGYSPGEEIIVTTLENNSKKNYEIILGEHPTDKNFPYLGIGFSNRKGSGILGSIMNIFSFKDPNIYYNPRFGLADFIYNFLWWIVLINFSVALVNMLPVGIFDGGRFFYLGMLALTKSQIKAKKLFALVTYAFLVLLAVIMTFWVINMMR